MSEWEIVKIEDLLLIPCRNGLTKPSKIRGNGVKMIAMGELFAHPIIYDVEMDRVPVTEKEIQLSNIIVNDLLFARQSLTLEGAGKCSIVKEVNEITVFESHLIRLRINSKKADPWFVYYYFNSYYGIRSIQNIVNQVAAAGIKGSDLVKLEIAIPSMEIQKKISAQLSEIDSKIECNRKICANLEQQAQAIFKSWFVDFEPFKDGEFVESELGMIPKGWRVGSFGEIAELKKTSIKPLGGVIYIHYSIPAFDNSKNPSLDEGTSIKSNKLEIKNGAVLLSKLNPTTKRIWYVGDVPKNSVSSTEFLPFYAKNIEYSPFVYCYLNCNKVYREIANGAKGTTNSHQRIDANTIISKTLVFSEEIIGKFCEYSQPIMQTIINLNQENHRLSSLRDTLLPKLMSGKIKV